MARFSLSLFLLGCTLLQYTLAEFGSIGTVQSSQTIKTSSDATTALFAAVDNENGLVLTTNYVLFTTVLPLMTSLATQVTTLGTTLTSTISASVPNHSGNLNAVFTPIQDAVTALIGLIDGQQATTRTSLTTLLGSDVNHLFGDVFGNMRLALLQIQSSFSDLKAALSTATILAGRARVPSSVVSEVLVAVSMLRATVLPVQYTVYTTIENVQMGDLYLSDLHDLSLDLISSLSTYYSDFQTELDNLGTETKDARDTFESDWSIITGKIAPATSNYATLSAYSTFNGALSTYNTAYNELVAINTDVQGIFSTYLSTASTYLTQYNSVLVPLNYLSITTLLEVLVAGGPYARFCYFKYSPRLIYYFSNLATDVDTCFNVEIDRLSWLYDLAESLIKLISFDLEDLIDNLTVCNLSSSPGNCIDAIGPYYVKLFAKTDYKVGFFKTFAQAEAKASINRLGACMYSMKEFNMLKLITVTDNIKACRTNGPDAPDLGQ